MRESKITINDLGSVAQSHIRKLAEHCCETGEAPLSLARFRSGEIHETYRDLKDSLNNCGKELETHDCFSSEDFTASCLIEYQIRQDHLTQLLNPILHAQTIRKNLPELSKLLIAEGDDIGLVPVRDLRLKPNSFPGRQWLEFNDKAIFLTPSIPGGLNASLPLSELLCSSNADPTLLVRPDSLRIVPINGARALRERAATYGKPFNLKWLDSLSSTQIAQHDPEPGNNKVQGYTSQFIWERLDKHEVQFSCEELPHYQDHSRIQEWNSTRFVHGIYNQKSRVFTHFDGALHLYKDDDYRERLSLHLKSHFMSYQKAKMFRLDSAVTFKFAEMLLTTFYRWNALVPEYFTHHS